MRLGESLLVAIERENIIAVKTVIEKAKSKHVNMHDIFQKEDINGFDYSPLHQATCKNNLKIVKLLLKEGVDINQRAVIFKIIPQHYTALETAAEKNCKEIAEYLLKKGASTSVQKPNSCHYAHEMAPLHLASQFNTADIVDLILKFKGEVDVEDSFGYTPLHYAVKNGNVSIILKLLSAGANVNVVNKRYGENALHTAAGTYHNAESVIKLLLEKGADLEEKDGATKRTPLKIAIGFSNFEATKVLIKNGAKLEPSCLHDIKRSTVFLDAVKEGNMEIIELFLKAGVNVRKSYGCAQQTVLHAVAFAPKNIEPMIKIFLENGADLEQTDENDKTPLQLSISRHHLEAAKIYIKNGACLDWSDLKISYKDFSPLLEAIKDGNLELVKQFLKDGADVAMSNGDTDHFLMHAIAFATKNVDSIIFILLANGANIEKKDVFGLKPLQLAIVRRNFDAAKLLIKNGAYLHPYYLLKKYNGYTPLFEAVKDGHVSIVVTFLRAGSDVTISNGDKQYTVLHAIAFAKQNIEPLINVLLEKGADLEKKDKDGMTPLQLAMIRRNIEALKELFYKGAFFDASFLVDSSTDSRPLFEAVKAGSTRAAKLFLNAGANISMTSGDKDYSVLHAVVFTKQNIEPMIKLLLREGADLEKKDKDGVTPLRFAIQLCNFEAAKMLIKKGAHLDPSYLLKNSQKFTPLFQAIESGDVEMVNIFLNASADVSATNGDKDYTVIHAIALAKHNIEPMTGLLLAKGVDLNKKDRLEQTALEFAINKRNFVASKVLIKNGAYLDPSYLLKKGWDVTPLYSAVRAGDVEMVGIFLKAGADVTITNGYMDDIVLHAVAYSTHNIGPMVQLLIDKGVDVHKQNKEGVSALQLAIMRRNFEAVKILIKCGAYLDPSFLVKNSRGFSPLFEAVREGDLETVDILLNAGADVTVSNGDSDYTMLHAVAFAKQNIELMINVLLEKGAELHKLDKDGLTPLEFASSRENFEATKELIRNGANPWIYLLM